MEVKTTTVKICYMTLAWRGNLYGWKYYQVAVGQLRDVPALALYITGRFPGVLFSSVSLR